MVPVGEVQKVYVYADKKGEVRRTVVQHPHAGDHPHGGKRP